MTSLLFQIAALSERGTPTIMLLAKATLILLLALGITVAMQRTSAGARHLVWLVTLGTLLIVPAIAAWTPLRLEILPASTRVVAPHVSQPAASARPTGSAPVANETSIGASSSPANTVTPERSGIVERISSMSAFTAIVTIWSAVVLILCAYLAWGALTVRRIVRNAQPLDSPDWLTPLYEVADRLSLDESPRLLASDEAKMPFACGILRPTIVLPADCRNWNLDRRRAVLLHELAHVRRHDLIGHTLGRIACAVYWFHPLVWTAAKRLRSESERACDDLAIVSGARASDYAEHLLDIVTSVRHDATPAVALAMARRKEFEGRMLAILDPELRHSTPSRRQSTALIASLAVISLVVGAAAPTQRPVRQVVAMAPQPTTQPQLRDVPKADDDKSPKLDKYIARSLSDPKGRRADVDKKRQTETETNSSVQSSSIMSGVTNSVTSSVTKAVTSAVANPVTKSTTAAVLRDLIAGGKQEVGQGKNDERPALLAGILRNDSSASLRRIAAWGLAEYGESQVAVDALSAAVRRDPNASVREMAAWALAQGDESSTAADALAAALHSDSDVKVRATAAWSLAHVGDRNSAPALAAALSDPSASVRFRAAWALGHVEPKEAPRALMTMLRDSDPKIREVAAWSLYQIQDPSSVAALNAALRAETDKDLQIDYIRALAAIGENSVDAIRGLLTSNDPRIRSMAVRALAGGHAAGPWPWPMPEPRPFP